MFDHTKKNNWLYSVEQRTYLMKKNFQGVVLDEFEQSEPVNEQVMFMGGALIFLNLTLMVFVGLYWTNPTMHQYISGKPL